MSVGFNLSTSREDLSTRLRAQNLKRARNETQKLEHESKKMEERLRELKMAMSREKEEREQHGGGFWKTGKTGNLSTYPNDILKKTGKSPNSSGKKKFKVLKDKPIETPERNAQPGTLAFIAKKGTRNTPRDKIKGPRCGQCEEKTAAVSCVQCNEDYCPGCFAAFHLKGALKKHRSLPLSATGPRHCLSPRPVPNQTSISVTNESASEGPLNEVISYNGQKNRNDPEGASGSYDGIHNDGEEFDEDVSAASFQEALQAWRNGQAANQKPSPRPLYTPVKTPVVSVDCSTEMPSTPCGEVNIKFNTHSLSYADRLMLKKHRRTDVEYLSTPRCESFEESKDSEVGSGDSVSFQALYEAVTSCKSQEIKQLDARNISIVQLHDKVLEEMTQDEGKVSVQEVDSMEAWKVENSRTTPKALYRPNVCEETEPSPRLNGRLLEARRSSYSTKNFDRLHDVGDMSIEDIESGAVRIASGKSSGTRKMSAAKYRGMRSSDDSKSWNELDFSSDNISESVKENLETVSIKKPESNRPKSGVRSKSRHNQSRPGSRAKSRAASQLKSEGHLTKSPSANLSMVARMSIGIENVKHGLGLEDFFTMGVKTETKDRTLTPANGRPKSSKSSEIKISNRLYQMAPRSWRPDHSLAETVPANQMQLAEMRDNQSQGLSVLLNNYGEEVRSETPVKEDQPTWSLDSRNQAESITPRSTPSFTPTQGGTPTPRPPQASRVTPSPKISSRQKKSAKSYYVRQSPIDGKPESISKSPSHVEASGRLSQAIVVDGEDMSVYDEAEQQILQNEDDEEALGQLEWELASQSGRVTVDGKISRMSNMDDVDEDLSRHSLESVRSLEHLSQQSEGYDINSRLREEELAHLYRSDTDDGDGDYEDVRALK